MITKDDAMLAILELEDVLSNIELNIPANVFEAIRLRQLDIKAYIRNSQNIIVKAV